MERHALIIGISAYAINPLDNPVNDARYVSKVLQSRGFQCSTLENANGAEIEEALQNFAAQINQNHCFSLIFFAGHGVENHGAGYVLPSDFPLPVSSGRLKFSGISIAQLLSTIGDSVGPKMLVIDACRSSVATLSQQDWADISPELAEMRAVESSRNDVLIAYSTSASERALDGSGQHSLYCEHFCDTVMQHGLSVEDVIKNTGMLVMRDSGQRQRPWYYSSLNKSVSFSDLPQFSLIQSFMVPSATGETGVMALDSLGSAVFVSGAAGKVFYVTSSSCRPLTSVHPHKIAALAATSNDSLVVLDTDSNIHMIGKSKRMKADCRDPFGICVSPNESMVVVYGIDSFTVLSLSDSTYQCLYCETPHDQQSYYCAQFIDDDRLWVGGNVGRILEISNLREKPCLRTLSNSSNHSLYSMAQLENGSRVACVYGGGVVEFRDSFSGLVEKQLFLGHSVQTPCARRDSLVNLTSDDIIEQFLLDPMSLDNELLEILSDNLQLNDLLFCTRLKSQPILAVGSNEGLVYLIDTRDGQVFQILDTSAGRGRSVNGVCFIEPNMLAILTGDFSVNFYSFA